VLWWGGWTSSRSWAVPWKEDLASLCPFCPFHHVRAHTVLAVRCPTCLHLDPGLPRTVRNKFLLLRAAENTTVITATQEAKAGGLWVPGQSRQS
jgi:hypothetical protein